jgi:signal transduction histidine kinase/CheY-like chemotaxis protein
MDFGGSLTDVAAYVLWLQAGAIIALAVAGLAATARFKRQMEAREAEIAAENDGLRDEVRRLKQAASALNQVEAASEAKSRFLTTVSHEIRTPISGILGMADLLRDASLDLENASYVEAIRSSGSALVALVDEILDLAKIEAGRFDLVVETVDLRRLTESVVELLAPRAQSKGIEVVCSFSAAAPRFVRADGRRLRQVLTNLGGNAVKFTDQGGVCVTVERSETGAARFSVIDTGPGVPEIRRAAIFEAFEHGDGSQAERFEGAGLGLAISRELVRLMGGDLTLADNPGGGSIFAFAVRLPECAAVETLAAAREARRRAPEGTRALIVADSPFEAPAMEARLAEVGVSVERACGLESGLEALSAPEKPNVVIVDCALGPEATNQLAQAAREAGVRRSLVLFSPFERRAFGQTALKDFDGWLVKPVRARSLFERAAWDSEPAPSPAPRLSPSPSIRRALVAEDNDINALITEKALRRLGFEVVRARDGEEALHLASPIAPLESRPFDVILMDLKMPGLDGYEATRRLRRLEAACGWSPTPIVALTANAFDERRGSPSAAGFDAFLVKPVEPSALAGTVERVCATVAAPWRERLRAS